MDKKVASGAKHVTPEGIRAIKNGQKDQTDAVAPRGDKPKWLRFQAAGGGPTRRSKNWSRSTA